MTIDCSRRERGAVTTLFRVRQRSGWRICLGPAQRQHSSFYGHRLIEPARSTKIRLGCGTWLLSVLCCEAPGEGPGRAALCLIALRCTNAEFPQVKGRDDGAPPGLESSSHREP